MKQKFYDIVNMLRTFATYMLLLGERSNGKSWQAKYVSVWEAYNQCDYLTYKEKSLREPKARYQFAYLRRWKEDLKQADIESYFADCPISDITGGEYNSVRVKNGGNIFLAKVDDELNVEYGPQIGKAFCLSGATHYKSLSFPLIGNVLFEEFITDDGYLPNEVSKLFSIISTIARRDKIRVFMIGNTISRLCPYFQEFGLSHVKDQKQGTIDVYKANTGEVDDDGNDVIIEIAVEFCESTGQKNVMFFGQKAKMITTGVWDTNIQPHLPEDMTFKDYKCYYQIFYEYGEFAFMINLLRDKETKEPFLFVYPAKTKSCKRVVSDKFALDKFTTNYLTELTKYDKIIIDLISQKRVTFSDNLTGTEFYQMIKERGKV